MGGGGPPASARGTTDGGRRVIDDPDVTGAGVATNGSSNAGGARTPEWTGLAPHPSLMIPSHHSAGTTVSSAFGPGGHDPSR